MLYFAYGSMMDFAEMRGRCPLARFVATAKLLDNSLGFTRYSNGRGCGVADAVQSPGSRIWGVVYEIPEGELGRLDEGEGFRQGRPRDQNAYVREEVLVLARGIEDQPLEVSIYFANRQSHPPRPNSAYKRLLVQGAKHWHLPESYQTELGRIEVSDPEHPEPTDPR